MKEAEQHRSETESDPLPSKKERREFLLGGKDYEMDRVKKMLKRTGTPFVDRNVTWEGAEIQSYQDDIDRILDEGNTPVAVELRGADQVDVVEEIDHHNEKSNRPASILQVLEKLNIEPSLVNRLAGANDSGYYPAMEAVVAEEIARLEQKYDQAGLDEAKKQQKLERAAKWMSILVEGVRRKDREAQGVTEEMEQEAKEAIEHAEKGPNGLMIVRLNGDRPSPVTDRLHYTWQDGKQNLVVICNQDKDMAEVWFFGRGDYSKSLRDHYLEVQEREKEHGTRVGNEYHTWGGGAGSGSAEQDAFSAVVVRDPSEVIDFIITTESK